MWHFIKIVFTIIIFLTLALTINAQKEISFDYAEIKRAAFESCSSTTYLISNCQINKQNGILKIPISGKPSKIFKDNNSVEELYEFEYLGNIKRTRLSLIKRIDYNSEEFYLLNDSTGTIDTLIGKPIFAQNLRDFVCINNPGTDEKQIIQICEITNGSVKTRLCLKGREDAIIISISCIYKNSIFVKDNKGKYWKLFFKTDN